GDRDLRPGPPRTLGPFTQCELAPLGIEDPPLRLRSEQLALEPLELSRQFFISGEELLMGSEQGYDVLVIQRRGLLIECHALFLPHRAPFAKNYSIENQTKFWFADLLLRISRRKMKSALLKLLGEQAVPRAVPRHELDVVPAPVEKDVQAIRQRILLEHVPDH